MSRRKVKEILHTFEGRTHHLMVNASDEEEFRKRFSVRGAHFNHNIYVNEHLYQPHNEPKIYDAIYTARLTPFKRHWLAKNVERLMVVSYGGDLHTFCPELKHAEFNKEFIPRLELARKYNQSYAGLCLSAREGAMFASCEYLLSGIPIVSTPSKGGRDEFFTMQNSLIVPPQPEAVAQAVKNWKQIKPKPQEIREQTLKQINHLRLSYCTYISQLISQESGDCKKPEELMENYFAPPDGIHSRFLKLENLWTSQFEDLEKAFSL
ncbi:MAG: glycosyltransferase [Rhizonema sp. NSF051]|nr:glycosyltransferase [Rhizonema sp. NSF051]